MSDKTLKKLLGGILEVHALSLLDEKPMHGYAIITTIRKRFGVYFGPSTVYPLLTDLEKKGYAVSEWIMGTTNRPQKVYKLTLKGKVFLEESQTELKIAVQPILLTAQ